MKRIGILTFHKSINYGSVLQSYALSKLLEKNGYDVEIIDYEPASYKSQYRIFEKFSSIHNIAANVRRLVFFDMLWKQKRGFINFRKNNLPLSKQKFTALNSASDFENMYYAIVCGSDQIWNVRAKDCDPIFFLPGTQKYKKIAYAASVNTASYKEECCDDKLRTNILDFNYIAIREHSGAKKISTFLKSEKEIKVQPDPSLLQDKDTFAELASERIVKEHYIFMYCANYQETTIEAARKISDRLHKPVYTVPVCRSATQFAQLKKAGIQIIRDKNRPEDFISYIINADLVISDSFHGTAFSIIFEKSFFSINDFVNGKFVNDERICNVLSDLGILERYIKPNEVDDIDLNKEIDYSSVTEKRLSQAKNAVAELVQAIET